MSASMLLAPKRNMFALQPALAQFFFHQRQPFERLFRSADPASRLETYSDSSLLRNIREWRESSPGQPGVSRSRIPFPWTS